MQETDDDLTASEPTSYMTPGQIMQRLCQDFLDENAEGEERAWRFDRIAELINNQPGMDAPYPTTAKQLWRKIDGLIDSACTRYADDWLRQIEVEEADWDDYGLTLEDLAFHLEDAGEY